MYWYLQWFCYRGHSLQKWQNKIINNLTCYSSTYIHDCLFYLSDPLSLLCLVSVITLLIRHIMCAIFQRESEAVMISVSCFPASSVQNLQATSQSHMNALPHDSECMGCGGLVNHPCRPSKMLDQVSPLPFQRLHLWAPWASCWPLSRSFNPSCSGTRL